ncbi:M81 family metallopeptidase [Devosia sp. SD17-2]|uniref:M81 family metallopeptidase n=1 Tax=Devosia sp. SD17-2 TaxID=2976459 RepID=UPI0023D8A813|nr:M81 family metallopeptidase [Devosia sp. SD17-2]WEJ35007.1 M81 family metallopeptidase [Devosia sp. SD17-2]
MRVFSAVLATETNTFSPIPTGLYSFVEDGDYYPAGQHPDHMTLYGGQLWAARERGKREGWTLFEGLTASAQPGGRTTKAAYETLRDQILHDLKAVLPVDMVLLALHGAMVAEGYDDCEGDILTHVRQIVGPDVVVGAEIDPHCHLTDTMVEQASLILTYKEYPHTDIYESGVVLVDLCARIRRGEINPVAALTDTNMVSLIRTTTEPGLSLIQRIRALEKQDGIVSISIAQGFPWADVPDMGTRILVYADTDSTRAKALSQELADDVYTMRDELSPPMLSVDAALDQALASAVRPVVIADTSDNAGGGASSDSTYFLERMIARDVKNAAIGPLWDPIAVKMAFLAGAGAKLPMRVGGKIGPLSGKPVDADWEVTALKRNHQMTGLGGVPSNMGDCALVTTGGISVLLASERTQAIDPDLFTGMGCDLAATAIVVVKSTQHFRAGYERVAADIIYAGPPGSSSPDLSSLPYTKIKRPKWPIA